MPDRREGDVVAAIRKAVPPGRYDLNRAEGRADFDDALRAELAKIEDVTLRQHAAEMVRHWREKLFSHPAYLLHTMHVTHRED